MKLRPFLLPFAVGALASVAPLHAAPHLFEGDGFSFTYDDAIFSHPKVRHEARVPDGDASDRVDGVCPEHWAVDFVDDKNRGYVWIMPTSDSVVKSFSKAYPRSAKGQSELRTLLKKRPANPKEAPVLPFPDVGIAFITKVRYLDFRSGSGMAWLSQWIYEAHPINSEELWYVFQGLTKDGKHYVSAEAQVRHSSLPKKAPTSSSAEFSNAYDAYLRKAVPELSKLPDETFQPSLTTLRTMFESIAVKTAP